MANKSILILDSYQSSPESQRQLIFHFRLWQTSGHWQHYADDMFRFEVEKEQFGLKPMNCPGHCVIFDHGIRSWKELPLRMADFGVLHRNEMSGALTGLTRVRRFQQDDAHIFCRPDQIKSEIRGALDFLNHIYSTFGYSFQLRLSTRPEKFLGEVAVWDAAEKVSWFALVFHVVFLKENLLFLETGKLIGFTFSFSCRLSPNRWTRRRCSGS